MAGNVVKCFFCGKDVDLNDHYFVITGPSGDEVHSCIHHKGLKEHGGIEVNVPEPEAEEVVE